MCFYCVYSYHSSSVERTFRECVFSTFCSNHSEKKGGQGPPTEGNCNGRGGERGITSRARKAGVGVSFCGGKEFGRRFFPFFRHRGARGHPTMTAVLRRGGRKHAGGRKQGTGGSRKRRRKRGSCRGPFGPEVAG